MLYFLAEYPVVQEKLRDQIRSVCSGQIVKTSDIQQLPYLTAVIFETTRLRPVTAVGPFREIDRSVKVCGVTIPEGTMTNTPFYALQTDEKAFTEPEKFLPERWIDQSTGRLISNQSWLPFSAGPRQW